MSDNSIKTPVERFGIRKRPTQSRSRSTVDSIRQAALLVFQEDGADACTTQAIATKAGVSIGSLYQYFPNGGAIFASIYEEVCLAIAMTLKSQIPDAHRSSVYEVQVNFLRILLDIYDRDQTVLIDLVQAMPELRLEEQPCSIHAMAQGSIRAYLIQKVDGLTEDDLERMTFFVTHLLRDTVKSYVIDGHERIEREAFIHDLSSIVAAYIERRLG